MIDQNQGLEVRQMSRHSLDIVLIAAWLLILPNPQLFFDPLDGNSDVYGSKLCCVSCFDSSPALPLSYGALEIQDKFSAALFRIQNLTGALRDTIGRFAVEKRMRVCSNDRTVKILSKCRSGTKISTAKSGRTAAAGRRSIKETPSPWKLAQIGRAHV